MSLAHSEKKHQNFRHCAFGFGSRLLIVVAAWLFAASSVASYAETLSEVINRHHQARGGIDKLQMLHSVRMTGAVEAGGFATGFTVLRARPDRIRIEMDLKGELMLRVFDGTNAWGINPVEGQSGPTSLSTASAANLRAQAPIDSVLVDPAAYGATLTLGGREEHNGIESWRIDVRSVEGPEQCYWIDTRSYMVHERRSIWRREGGFEETTTRWSDHRNVEGVLFAHRQQTFGRHVTQTATTMSSTATPPRTTTISASRSTFPSILILSPCSTIGQKVDPHHPPGFFRRA